MADKDDGASRWDYENMDWAAYRNHRPPYVPSLYDLIFDFHANGNAEWDTAADIGCGGGVITIELARRFDKLIACDLSREYLATARAYLTANILEPDRRLTILQTGAETLDAVPDASVDMITMGMMLHWVDQPAALAENYRILKSGGTMVGIMYGSAVLAPGRPDVQDALDAIYNVWWLITKEVFDKKSRPQLRNFFSELENLDFEADKWSTVDRYRWRPEEPFGPHNDWGRNPSAIKPGEKVVNDCEAGRMRIEVDTQWLKTYYDHWIPHPDVLKTLKHAPWDGLDRVLQGGKFLAEWPAVLVLARKR